MNRGAETQRFHLLLTVPNLQTSSAPWRETLAIARWLPRSKYRLTICSLRNDGVAEAQPLMAELGVSVFVACFRPRGKSVKKLMECLRDQRRINQRGPF